MEAPKLSPERMLEVFKAVDRYEYQARLQAATKPGPRARKSNLSVRLDRDGNPRWFHATKGWRGRVIA